MILICNERAINPKALGPQQQPMVTLKEQVEFKNTDLMAKMSLTMDDPGEAEAAAT